MSSPTPQPVSRFKRDLGIRATLALVATVAYELLILTAMILLYLSGKLDVTTALAILGLGQSPALLSMGYYFNLRTGTQPEPKQ